jgi:uncharacterized protein YcbK (DUF882 family)
VSGTLYKKNVAPNENIGFEQKPISRREVLLGALGVGIASIALKSEANAKLSTFGTNMSPIPNPGSVTIPQTSLYQASTNHSVPRANPFINQAQGETVNDIIQYSTQKTAHSMPKSNIFRVKGTYDDIPNIVASKPVQNPIISTTMPRTNYVRVASNDHVNISMYSRGVPNVHVYRADVVAANEKRLSIHSVNTGESIDVVYWAKGQYDHGALREINRVMRDFRTGDITNMSLEMINTASRLQAMFSKKAPIEFLSGYRSPRTNEMLRRTTRNVARNSYHLRGAAVDMRIPGADTRNIRDAALKMRSGGVGYYSSSNFVHIDSGPFRTWRA